MWWLVACSTPSHYLNQCWLIANCILENNFQWNIDPNTTTSIQENWFENIVGKMSSIFFWPQCATLQWRHNGHNGVSNHQPYHCLLSCLFKPSLKKTSKLRVTGLCVGNSPVTGEFPAQMASNTENVSIWWCDHQSKEILHVFVSLFAIKSLKYFSLHYSDIISHLHQVCTKHPH